MRQPTLYVVAGPNGVGKTTAFSNLVPKNVTYINADLISQQLQSKAGNINIQELANQEASAIFYDCVQKRIDFSIETNLYDLDTYKSFIAVQALGYSIEIFFLCVDSIDICNQRISNRVKHGGHFVRPDIVSARYQTSLKLLEHYYNFPDTLIICDTSYGDLDIVLILEKGAIREKGTIKDWAVPIVNKAEQNPIATLSTEERIKQYKNKNNA